MFGRGWQVPPNLLRICWQLDTLRLQRIVQLSADCEMPAWRRRRANVSSRSTVLQDRSIPLQALGRCHQVLFTKALDKHQTKDMQLRGARSAAVCEQGWAFQARAKACQLQIWDHWRQRTQC